MKNFRKQPVFYPQSLRLLRDKEAKKEFSWSGEISAGLTVGMIALPLALALGIASIPQGVETPLPAPALGILTAIVAGLIIAVLGGSRVQIGGPTAAFIPIILLIVSEHGYSGMLLATMMAGGILIVMGLARMGALIRYIPWPVTSGFTSGIAVAIMLTQVRDFAGLTTGAGMPREFTAKVGWIIDNLHSFNGFAIGLAVACVAVIWWWPKLKIKYLPGPVVALLMATLFTLVMGWSSGHGVETIGTRFGANAIPDSLPWPSMPVWSWSMVRELIGPATAIALLGAIESLLSDVVADGLSGNRHDSNTELIAQGIANLVCPFFGGLPATGAIARTSANISNGGKTPLAGIIHAMTLLGVVLLAARWAVYIPMATMSAILVVVALRMGEWHELVRLHKMPRSDALVLVTTFGLTVVFDLVIAVEVGMVLAAILFIKRVSETTEISQVTEDDMLERPEHIALGKKIPDGVIVYRIFGPFLFGAAEMLEDALLQHGAFPRVIILRLNLVSAMDITALNALESVVERAGKHQAQVIISGIHRQPLAMLLKADFVQVIGRENFCATYEAALVRADQILKNQGQLL